jgi:hypothetical protein
LTGQRNSVIAPNEADPGSIAHKTVKALHGGLVIILLFIAGPGSFTVPTKLSKHFLAAIVIAVLFMTPPVATCRDTTVPGSTMAAAGFSHSGVYDGQMYHGSQ